MVTGAGSMVGQGIIKSLRLSQLSLTLIAADNAPLYAGLYRSDEAVLIPRTEVDGAYEEIVSILNQKQIDILMIGSEFDLSFFAEHKDALENETNTLIVVSNADTVRIANDKWLMVQFLKNLGLPHPLSFLCDDVEQGLSKADELGYPFIIKPRHGTSARNVHIINHSQDLKNFFHQVESPILQKMIKPPKNELDCEFTCSLFKAADGEIVGPFNSRRILKNGSSWVTEVKPFEFLNTLLLNIGTQLDFMGSFNIQLMNTEDGPVPFEFNARSSGTTAIRSYFGFNEPEMTILSYYLGKKIPSPKINDGYCLRYVEELFLPADFLEESKILNVQAEKMDWF